VPPRDLTFLIAYTVVAALVAWVAVNVLVGLPVIP
jgi:hypothetical protein